MATPFQVRVFQGAWQRNDDGYWIFQRKPSDLGYLVSIKATETFDGLDAIIRQRYNLKPETPLSLAYHPPDWMLEPDGTRKPPTTVSDTDDVEEMMHLRTMYRGLTLCVSSGPEDVATFQFLMKTTFTVAGATFVFKGLDEREIVASKEILEEVFNEQQLVGIYRAHLEIERSKEAARGNGASGSGSPPSGPNDDSASAPSGSGV